MIKSLKIKDFQCHSNFSIELDPKITTIVGPSDIGKSAIIRALRWVCSNRPDGDGFIKHGTKETEVSIQEEQHTIRRVRGSSNLYFLEDQRYASFGRGNVPDTVEKTLNTSEINFQGQLDGPFWLSLTAGEVSRQLNDIVDLGIIDKSLSSIAKKVRNFRESVQIARDNLKTAKQRRDDLKWITEAKNQYDSLEVKQEQLNRTTAQRQHLALIVARCSALQLSASTAATRGQDAALVGKLAHKYRALQEQRIKLSVIIKQAKELKEKAEQKIPNFKAVEKQAQGYYEIVAKRRSLSSLISKVKLAKQQADKLMDRAYEADKSLHESMEGQCPICGKVL